MTTAEIIRLLALCAHIIFGFVAAVVISLRRKPATAYALCHPASPDPAARIVRSSYYVEQATSLHV